jgi:general L-amino acid transport system substrate-binding protein
MLVGLSLTLARPASLGTLSRVAGEGQLADAGFLALYRKAGEGGARRVSDGRVRARLSAILLALCALALAAPAHAGSVLDRVRATHTVRCGATARPGLASEETAAGLLPDICRAVAVAVLGPSAQAAFHIYDADVDFDAVRNGADDVFFLDATAVAAQHLAGKLVPGPTVYIETISVMVKDADPAQHVADLAGKPICFMLGDAAQRNLEAWFAARSLPFMRMGYQEEGEMTDAFDSRVCRGLAAETTTLAEYRLGGDMQQAGGRILPEALTEFPILAMTGTQDAQWSAVVAWTVDTLIAAEAPRQDWSAGGVDALPLALPELGLPDDWQRQVIAAVGSYGDIYRRHLGAASPLKLPPGPNASWRDSGLMLAPHAE